MSNQQLPQWYLGINNEATPPLTFDEVKAYFVSGKANANTPVWTAGMTDWAPAKTIDPMRSLIEPPALKPMPPALPKVPVTAAVEKSVAVPVELSPEKLMEQEFGLTPEKIEAMATLAIELADQAKVMLGLSEPKRMGLVKLSM